VPSPAHEGGDDCDHALVSLTHREFCLSSYHHNYNCILVIRYKHVLPEVNWEEYIATSHGREWTCPLCVLAVQCPLQMSPIIQPRSRYIHTAVPHVSYKLHWTLRYPLQKLKKFVPPITGTIEKAKLPIILHYI